MPQCWLTNPLFSSRLEAGLELERVIYHREEIASLVTLPAMMASSTVHRPNHGTGKRRPTPRRAMEAALGQQIPKYFFSIPHAFPSPVGGFLGPSSQLLCFGPITLIFSSLIPLLLFHHAIF